MNKVTLVLISKLMLIASLTSYSQSVIFSEDFENVNCPDIHDNYYRLGYLPIGWKEYDMDNTIHSGGFGPYFDSYGARVLQYVGSTQGQKALFYAKEGLNISSEDWMITPQITIPGTGITELNFELNAGSGYTLDIFVSTTGNTVSDFSSSSILTYNQSNTDTTIGVNLSAYAGQSIYIGYRYKTSSSYYASSTEIDDIKVINNASSSINENNSTEKIIIHPNPTNGIINVSTTLNEKTALKVFDANGKIILNDSIIQNGTSKIDLSSHEKGIYFIEIMDSSGKIAREKVLLK